MGSCGAATPECDTPHCRQSPRTKHGEGIFMRTDQMPQLSNLEKAYCQTPETIGLTPKLAVIGGGTGALHLLRRLIQHLEATGRRITPGEIVVFEGGTLDILSHMGNSGLPRIQLQEA